MNIKELYQEIILEHGKNPRNLRKTENFNKDAMGKNPLCGDNVHVFLKLDENKKVEDTGKYDKNRAYRSGRAKPGYVPSVDCDFL